jgi:DNA recombination protein RmuC
MFGNGQCHVLRLTPDSFTFEVAPHARRVALNTINLPVIGSLLLGLFLGAAAAWFWFRSRVTLEIERTRSEGAVELASIRERAMRIPALETQISKLLETEQSHRAEILHLTEEQAQRRQLLRSTEEQLIEAKAELTRREEQLEALSEELTASKERQATLTSEAARVPALEQRIKESDSRASVLHDDLSEAKESLGRVATELRSERESSSSLRAERDAARTELRKAQDMLAQLAIEKSDLTTRLQAEREQAVEKLALLNEAKQTLSDQFKALANDILEEKSKRFAEQNQTNLGQLLDPLKSKLTEFQSKVEDVYVKETRDRTALGEQVRQLMSLNQCLSADAKNLTQALKGSNKAQGNYGELVLERVLESSGLRDGEEYVVQARHTREDGSRAQPDVVIRLPESRNLVVDSKISLVAYDESVSAECDEEREAAIARHITSVRAHIKGLSEKNYQSLYQLKSLDFVLMFVPIEPAFMLAVTHDRDLFMEAWNRNVLLVSPSTLMFVVRTVAHLWRQEAQSRNAQEIAKRGAELYDRLQAFVVDLEKVGDRLRQAQESFNDARDKLSKNKGNVIRQAEMLKRLGVKPTKVLPLSLVEKAADEDSEEEDLPTPAPPAAALVGAL